MTNNISSQDLSHVISFLQTDPILTGNKWVAQFEADWSRWLGMKYSVFVGSGSSANFLSMAVLRELLAEEDGEHRGGEIIVPTLGWVSNIVSVLKNGFTPVFADIRINNLSMDTEEILRKVTPRTRGVFLAHIMGFNGLSVRLLDELHARGIPIIEDACESIGATFQRRKVGTFGLISNFSFYYGHHMTTIEGGMVCTNSERIYQMARIMRGHGMVRESTDLELRKGYVEKNPELHEDFIFAYPGHNFRNNEINAVLGIQQLKRLDENNRNRIKRFDLFLGHLDQDRFFVDFDMEGSCNYALLILLRKADGELVQRIAKILRENRVEFRRGTSGGGNQLRQPYLRHLISQKPLDFRVTDYVHFNGFYVGNYPGLSEEKIIHLCRLINGA